MKVKFIGGILNGELRELPDTAREWFVPVLIRKPVKWTTNGEDFDVNSGPDTREEVYRKAAALYYGLVHFLHSSVNEGIHEVVERMYWPDTVGDILDSEVIGDE